LSYLYLVTPHISLIFHVFLQIILHSIFYFYQDAFCTHNLGKTLSENQKNKIRKSQPCSIPVIVHGKYHISIAQAAEFEKVSSATMMYRLKSTTFKMSSYRFATEEEIVNFSAGAIVED